VPSKELSARTLFDIDINDARRRRIPIAVAAERGDPTVLVKNRNTR
jgi:hypothetical protein